jgi:flagellum-specific ATP synthase
MASEKSSAPIFDFTPFKQTLEVTPAFQTQGTVTRLVGIGLEASLPDPVQGQIVKVDRNHDVPLICEVIGFDKSKVILLPYGELQGVRPGAPVNTVSSGLRINAGEFLIGRVVDGVGNPIDGGPEIPKGRSMPLVRPGPNPVTRPLISETMVTGVRAVDSLMTLGKGQRVGIFSGSGVGKSILMGMMARYTKADVNVIGLIGERGREVREFIEHDLGEEGLKRSVVVVATSNEPSLLRMRGALTATAIAEYFRDTGRDVLFMMDSLTRFALAGREVGLAAGEPPATRGYPPSVFGLIPRLLERAGRSEIGSITGLYTVLVEGDDLAEPISDIARATLDGHIVLSRDLADRGHYPAIDVLTSVSRVMRQVANPEHIRLARSLKQHMAAYKEMEDLINIGAYQRGTNNRADAAIDRMDGIISFLQQDMAEGSIFEEAIENLRSAVGETREAETRNDSRIPLPPQPSRKLTGDQQLTRPPVMPPGAYDS